MVTTKVNNTNTYTLLASHSTASYAQYTVESLSNFKEIMIELSTTNGNVWSTTRISHESFINQNSNLKQLIALYGTTTSAQSYYVSNTSVYMLSTSGYTARLYGIK